MKIHFDNVNFSSRSGPNTFASRLATVLTERGHEIVRYSDPHDAVLVFIEPTRQWKKGCRVVQRLDGIWFKPEQFNSHNRLIKWAYDNCDEVVWQSIFDYDMTAHHWGHKKGHVIGNGIDADRVKVTNRQKRLKENIEAYDILTKGDDNSHLIVMGHAPDHILNRHDIFYTGNIKHSLCLEIYSAADAMIHLAWLDHCPNVVVEAISQDCPVICTDSGGTKEILGTGGYVVSESQKYNFELLDYDNPYDLDLSCLRDVDVSVLEVDKSKIDLLKVADKYEKVLCGT